MEKKKRIEAEDFLQMKSRKDLIQVAQMKGLKTKKYIWGTVYEEELRKLQAEMVTLQQWIQKEKKRLALVFEGRDASGKGGAIKRFKEHLNPRSIKIVALKKPTEVEQGQWYFRRYIRYLPNPGEIVFFDRSWYNRGVVEPVMGFCTQDQYEQFLLQVPEFEHMLYEDGVDIIKFWFSITKDEQEKRFKGRLNNPLKVWKFSNVDKKGLELWDRYSFYKEQMFSKTHTSFSPWIIVQTNDKKTARLESIRYVLSQYDYPGKGETGVNLFPDPNVVFRYHRNVR